MTQPACETHAPGLTESQISNEKKWLQEFSEAADCLDWTKWAKFWDNASVLQFNSIVIEGKTEIGKHFEQQFSLLQSMEHTITRLSFVTPPDLVFQNANVAYKVKGDHLNRVVHIPGIAVIHKKLGESMLTKFETYIDMASLMPVIKEVSERS